MRKYIVLLVFAIIYGFVGMNKASGQSGCEVCVAPLPGTCYVLNFSIPGCCDNMQAVFCYECYVTRPGITIYVAEITYCPQCDDAAWDYVHNWAVEHMPDLCGNRACDDPPPTEVYFSRPYCAEIEWNGPSGRVTVRAHPGPCDQRCTEKWEWCRDYSTTPPTIRKILLERYVSGSGTCQRIAYGYAPDAPDSLKYSPGISWRIECARNLSVETCIPYP